MLSWRFGVQDLACPSLLTMWASILTSQNQNKNVTFLQLKCRLRLCQTWKKLNTRSWPFHGPVRDLHTGLVFLFPGHSEEELIPTCTSFQVFQFKNFLGSYADGLTELSPKWQCLSLTPCHPHQLRSIPAQPRTPGQPSTPLSSEVGLVAFSSTLILQLWQAEISVIPLDAIKLGPSFVQAQRHLFNSIKRKSNKGNNEKFKIISNTWSHVSATFLDFLKETYVRLLWNQWSLNLALSVLDNKLFLKMTNHQQMFYITIV